MNGHTKVIDQETDLVYSPDDGGYYLQWYPPGEKDTKVSKQIFPSEEKAIDEYNNGCVIWE